MPEVPLVDQPGPWRVTRGRLADANISGLSIDVGAIVLRMLMMMEYEPEAFAKTPEEPGGHQFSIGLADCPGGPLVIRFSLDKQRMHVHILEVIHPALLGPLLD